MSPEAKIDTTSEIARQNEIKRSPELLIPYVGEHLSRITAHAARDVFVLVRDIHQRHGGNVPEELIKHLKTEGVDGVGSEVMILEMNATPFKLHAIDGEGDKHKHEGKAAPSVKGIFGQSGAIEVELTNDVVEQTSDTVNLRNGGISALIASTKRGGLRKINPEISYVMGVVTSGKPDVSTTYAPEKNIHNIIEYNGIKAHELAIIFMDPKTRPVNIPIAKAVEGLGVRFKMIQSGTLMASVHAMIDPSVFGEGIKIAAFLGREGAEEKTIGAGVAKVLGATSEAQEYFVVPGKDGKMSSWELGKSLTLDEIIPGSPEDLIFNGTLVTNSNWTEKRGIRDNQNGHIATTMTITKKEGVVYKEIHLPPQDMRTISDIYRRNLGSFALPH